jgi:hypothetical protein
MYLSFFDILFHFLQWFRGVDARSLLQPPWEAGASLWAQPEQPDPGCDPGRCPKCCHGCLSGRLPLRGPGDALFSEKPIVDHSWRDEQAFKQAFIYIYQFWASFTSDFDVWSRAIIIFPQTDHSMCDSYPCMSALFVICLFSRISRFALNQLKKTLFPSSFLSRSLQRLTRA